MLPARWRSNAARMRRLRARADPSADDAMRWLRLVVNPRRASRAPAAQTRRRRSRAGGVSGVREVPAHFTAHAQIHGIRCEVSPIVNAGLRAATDALPMRLADRRDPSLLEPAEPLLAPHGLEEVERSPVVGHPKEAREDQQASHEGELLLQRPLPLFQLDVLSDNTAQEEPSDEAADVDREADALPLQGKINGVRHRVDPNEQQDHRKGCAGELLLLPIQEQVCQVSPQQRVATA
mmetsp:Transcript_24173/g.72611  ORF Transcript_24173/g.72611 Transcript_24173/m.72611 type:complete len:236 (+) Transcript_24173:71-778(+)